VIRGGSRCYLESELMTLVWSSICIVAGSKIRNFKKKKKKKKGHREKSKVKSRRHYAFIILVPQSLFHKISIISPNLM
jgi:hypothetical protein